MLKSRSIAAPLLSCLTVTALIGGCGPKAEEPDVVVAPPTNKIEIENTVQVPVANKAPNVVVVQPPTKKNTTIIENKSTTVIVRPTATPKLPSPAPQPTRSTVKTPPRASWKPVPPPGPRPKATPTRISKAPAPFKQITPKPAASGSGQSGKSDTGTKTAPLVARAQIVSVSKVPDLNNAPYQEALIFVRYKILSVEKGEYNEKELIAAHWGMQKKKLLPAARFKEGQTQRLELVPMNDRPDLERIMKWDTINDFELSPYFAAKVS